MSVKYLYHTESGAFGGSLSAAEAVPMLDQFLHMFGGERACIHPLDADYEASARECYSSLKEAQSAYPDYEWVYLDPNAPDKLEDFIHPKGDTVYVAGHDLYGYGDSNLSGARLKIMDFGGHAIPCLIATACDRWSKS